jgi:signal transduction histidine kinase
MASMFLVMVWHARRRQRAVEDLQASAERERDFLRDASHTLRTPITVAHGHAELIQAAATTPQIAADADIVIQELRNLSKLSDRILMLAAADHSSYMRLEPTSISSIVTRVAERWRAAAERDWQVVVNGENSIVEADRDQLEIALDALLENAVKHTIRSDTVRLVATSEGGSVVICVEDTGTGIREEHLPHIFERFYGAGAGERRGTGLGLAIVRSVVEAHGGTVTIDSEVGRGTSVAIRLPARVRATMASAGAVIPQE